MGRIALLNLGISNISSIKNALERLGVSTELVAKSDDGCSGSVRNPDFSAVVLPGVGNFRYAMNQMRAGKLDIWIRKQIENGTPFLGICLGMQLLADYGEEGGHTQGLGLVPGSVVKLVVAPPFRTPHQGWDDVAIRIPEPLYGGFPMEPRSFYFVHSYFFNTDSRFVSSTCTYGTKIPASVQKDNIFGTQFHPEKSQANGEQVLRNFLDYIRR